MSEHARGGTCAVLAGVIDAAPDGMLLVDDEGTILLANRQMELLFGYPREELLGRPVELLVPEPVRTAHRRHRAAFASHRATRPMGFGLPVFGLRRDGAELALEIRLSPLQTDDGACTIAVVRDLFDHLDAELRAVELRAVELRAVQTNWDTAVRDARQRAVRDLHDRISERLFAAGMAVQSAHGIATDPLFRDRLGRALEEIDRAIFDLRSPMFERHPAGAAGSFERHPAGAAGSLRVRVIEACVEMQPVLGFAPSTRFVGPVESVDPRVAETLLVVLREALSSVAQHAWGSSAAVTVSAGDDIVLVVEGDGAGWPTNAGGSLGWRLRALVARARELGGTLFVGPNGASGTRLEWRVPIR